MENIRRVNVKKDKYDIYIGRHKDPEIGKFGNPFSHKPDSLALYTTRNRNQSIIYFLYYLIQGKNFLIRLGIEKDSKLFNDLMIKRDIILKNMHVMKGKRIACFCRQDEKCHGDIYVDMLKEPTTNSIF